MLLELFYFFQWVFDTFLAFCVWRFTSKSIDQERITKHEQWQYNDNDTDIHSTHSCLNMAKALAKCIRKMYSKWNKKSLYCAAAQSHSHAERLRTEYAVHRADTMKEWLGAGIFTLRHGADEIERPQWYLQRKTASHIFKGRIFTKLMSNVFLGKSDMSWPATSHAYWYNQLKRLFDTA